MKPKNNKSGILITFIVAFIFLGAYFSYWILLGKKVNSSLEDLRSKGYQFSKTDYSGFPYRISLKIHDFSAPIGSKRFSASEVFVSASPFSPYLWVLEGAKDTKFGDDILGFGGFKASLRMNPDNQSPKILRLSIVGDFIKLSDKNILENFNLHLIGDKGKNQYAFSFEGVGLENLLSEQSDYKIPTIRGLLSDAELFDSNLDKWQQTANLQIKYGQIILSEQIFIKSGEYSNLNGNLKFNENKKLSGELVGDLNLQTIGNKDFERKSTKIIIDNSRLDFGETIIELMK